MESNRDLILDKATELFARRGYDAVGVQEIADAAGVKKPTLYHYFGSKAGLLQTLLDENFTVLFAALEQIVYHHDLTMTLLGITRAYFDFARRYRTFYRMQLGMWYAPNDSQAFRAVSTSHERQQAMLETIFSLAVEDHGNMHGRHRAYAATFLGMLNTYIGLALNEHIVLDDVLVYQAVHQFMHGIFS
ncbi:MAG: helix-turn-helix domain-containing protein [Anaerolineae bacterium]